MCNLQTNSDLWTTDAMTSKICNLGLDDHLRLCASVFDTLSIAGHLEVDAQNYLKLGLKCVTRTAVTKDEAFSGTTLIFPCSTIHDTVLPSGCSLASFYVLADVHETGAAFVFFPQADRIVELGVRITGIGALLHPVGKQVRKPPGRSKRGRRQRRKTREESVEEDTADEYEQQTSGIKAQRGRNNRKKVKKNRYSQDKDEEHSETEDNTGPEEYGESSWTQGEEKLSESEHSEKDTEQEWYTGSTNGSGECVLEDEVISETIATHPRNKEMSPKKEELETENYAYELRSRSKAKHARNSKRINNQKDSNGKLNSRKTFGMKTYSYKRARPLEQIFSLRTLRP